EPPARQVGGGEAVVRHRAAYLGAVGRKIGGAPDRARQHPRRGPMDDAVEPQVAVVACQPERDSVAPTNAPKGRHALERLAQEHPAHAASLISTSGTEGASPAANAAPITSSRSSAKRTGTSNRNPARTSASGGGASAKAIQPPS